MSDLGLVGGLWGLLALVSLATYIWRAGGVVIAARISWKYALKTSKMFILFTAIVLLSEQFYFIFIKNL